MSRTSVRDRIVLVLLCVALSGAVSWTQDTAAPATDDGYESYVRNLLVRAESACVVPAVGWAERRREVMRGLDRTLGRDLPRTWPGLDARVEGRLSRDDHAIEQISAEFWPGVRYAMQVFVPAGRGPFPGVVMVATGRHGPREALYQQMGVGFAKMGILVVGVLALGKGVQQEAYQYNSLALLVGTSIAQEQFHTGQRALEYLRSRPDVDAKRLGITGDSDGGWVTLYVATVDPRVTAAAPASTNYTFTGWLLPERWKTYDHAEGNAPEVLTYGANIPILTAANAPKWFRFLNSEHEWERLQYIPVIDAAARSAYEFAGVPERYSSHLSPCPHGLWPVMQIEDISWFSEIFFGRRPPSGALSLRSVAGKRFEALLVAKDGKPPEVVETIESGHADWRKLQVGGLDDDGGKPAFLAIIESRRRDARAARAAVRDRGSFATELRRSLGLSSLTLHPTAEARGDAVVLETEPGLHVAGRWVARPADRSTPVSLVVGLAADRAARLDPAPAARFDLELREEGALGPATWALVMLNRPPVGMWAWDAISAAHWLKREGHPAVELIGVGDTGAIVALLAGALSEDVGAVRVLRAGIRSLDEEIVARQAPGTPYWAHRLLWTADLPELAAFIEARGRTVRW